MATQSLQHTGKIIAAPKQGESLSEKVTGFFASVAHTLEPYIGQGRIEVPSKEGEVNLTLRDRAMAEVHLLSIF